jgi:hypothetical protein
MGATAPLSRDRGSLLFAAAHDTSARDEALPDLVKVEPRRPQSRRARRRYAESADLGRDPLVEGVAERIDQQRRRSDENMPLGSHHSRTRAEALKRPLQRLAPAGASETERGRFKTSRETGVNLGDRDDSKRFTGPPFPGFLVSPRAGSQRSPSPAHVPRLCAALSPTRSANNGCGRRISPSVPP